MPKHLLTLLFVLVLLFPAAAPVSAAQGMPITSSQSSPSSSVMFIENVGQFADGARFQVWGGPAGTMWLAEDAIWLTVVEPRSEEASLSSADPQMRFDPRLANTERESTPRKAANIKLSFVGANPHPRIEPVERLDTVVSYFIGNEPDKWQPDVPVWGGVRYVDLYPGVDLEVTSEGGQILQRLAGRPGADLGVVRLRVEGADAVVADGDALRLSTTAGEFALPLLRADGLQVAGLKVQLRGAETFIVAAPIAPANSNPASRDASSRQTAMPETTGHAVPKGRFPVANPQSRADNPVDLLYSTFLGGSSDDWGYGIAVDVAGSTYVTGKTASSDFPTTLGAFDTSYNVGDVFVAKLSPAGSGLAYATFLGGNSGEESSDIAVDGAGSAYVTGDTRSDDFPTTPDAFDTSYNGDLEPFVAKLNPTGSALAYATFLGGSDWDLGGSIAVDGAGSAYVTGRTFSTNFPTTPGAFDPSHNGSADAFAVKLNPGGSGLAYATFLGGSGSDEGDGIAVDGVGSAYVTGLSSIDFPTTAGAFDTSYNDGGDAFVAKLNPAGSGLTYATFLGGSSNDWGLGIAVDRAGSAHVTGRTESTNFPITPGAFDTSHNGGPDTFVVELNPGGSGLAYATFLGGSGWDFGRSIAVGEAGSAYVTGYTSSIDFPTTVGAFNTSYNGGNGDAFVARLNPAGSGLTYAAFLGGIGSDVGYGIAVDGAGSAYVMGSTNSSNFPTTPGTFDTSSNGNSDAFVAKLTVGPPPPFNAAELASQAEYPTVAPGAPVNFWIEVRNTGNTTWRASDGYGWRGDDQWLGDSGPVIGETQPGGIWRFERTFNAPSTPGEYVYGFMMRHGTQEFGPYFFIKVTVKQPSVTDFRANPNGFKIANTTLKRDWPMFRQAFGAANVACPAAEAFFTKEYESVAGGWSCFGFSSASMISFLGWPQPNAGQFAIPAYPKLYDELWSTALSSPVAYYAGTQAFKQYVDAYGPWLASCDQDSAGPVERIKQNLEAGEPMLLSLPWGQFNHAVTPYNVVYTSASEAQVYVYDSEAPGDNAKSIRFTLSGSQWQWEYTFVGSIAFAGKKSGGCKDMFGIKLSTLKEQGQPPVNWCATGAAVARAGEETAVGSTNAQAATGRMVMDFPPEGDAIVRDSQGRRLGWIAGQRVSEIPNAIPIPQVTASELPVSRGFYVPVGAYTLDAAQQTNGDVDTAVFGDGRVVVLEGKASGTTSLQVSSDLAESVIANPAAFTSLNTTLIEEQPASSTVALVSVTQPTEASPLTLRSNGNQVQLERAAGTLNYKLAYRNSGALDFVSPQVTLAANESHTITYDGSTALLQIDRGRDGTIDETRTLTNEVKRVYLPVIRR